METIPAFLALCFGLLVRLALPIAITLVLVYFLHRLDSRWQAEAHLQPMLLQKPESWKIKGCPLERQTNCIARTSSLPCWQMLRLPNGYLREECISCKVFIDAPIPVTKIESRRM